MKMVIGKKGWRLAHLTIDVRCILHAKPLGFSKIRLPSYDWVGP
jgi:hypothetical protein